MTRQSREFSVAALALLITFLIAPYGTPLQAASSYPLLFDFEGKVSPEWSTTSTLEIGGNRVLGPFNNRSSRYMKGTQLTLENLPPDAAVTLSFDLYLIGTWDSAGELVDRWTLSTPDGTIMDLTKFPNAFKDKEEKMPIDSSGTVAVRNRKMAYWVVKQEVAIRSSHIRGDRLVLTFEGSLSGKSTELWALDNVRVEAAGSSSKP